MLVTELKSNEDILSMLAHCDSVYLVGCNGCAEVCSTGGAEIVEKSAKLLKEKGNDDGGNPNCNDEGITDGDSTNITGEVGVVDENYGIKITDIIVPEKRLGNI